MKTIRRTKKAWLDTRGRMLPTEQLKEVSKSWDEKTWEQFLDSTDGSVEGLQLLSSKRLSCKTDYMTQSIFDLWAEKSDSEEIQQIIQIALEKLTSRQRQVIEATYFDGLSIEGAAAQIGITKSTAFVHLQKALLNLKHHIIVRPNDLTEMRAKENFSVDAPFEIDPEIYEVYLSEANRYGLNKCNFDQEAL